jgi:hypothetical protein
MSLPPRLSSTSLTRVAATRQIVGDSGDTVLLYDDWSRFPIARQAIIASDPFCRSIGIDDASARP